MFSKSDKKFKGTETLTPVSIVTDISGNKHVIKISKKIGHVQRDNMAYGVRVFQLNFIYMPVQ